MQVALASTAVAAPSVEVTSSSQNRIREGSITAGLGIGVGGPSKKRATCWR